MSKYLISLILLSVISMGVSAQRITRQYNNVSFSAALKDLNARQDKYVINFVYDELEDFKVTKNIKNESVPDAIMNLIGFYPIKMKQVDNIIIVECIQKASNRMMGRIVDTRHQPVDFANVALLNVSDSSLITGGVTNENGQFVIPCEVKKAIVKVSCVGYKTYCNAYRTGEVGAITLEDATINLQKIVIKGHRKYISRENGKLTLDVQNSNLKNIGKATDVIKYIPGMLYTNGKYEVFGKGEPVIYIDGRKQTNTSGLSLLSSTNVKSVQLITNPGAEYDAETRSVITSLPYTIPWMDFLVLWVRKSPNIRICLTTRRSTSTSTRELWICSSHINMTIREVTSDMMLTSSITSKIHFMRFLLLNIPTALTLMTIMLV